MTARLGLKPLAYWLADNISGKRRHMLRTARRAMRGPKGSDDSAVSKPGWSRPFGELPPRRRAVLTVFAFVLPLAAWCIVSYVPFIWHPMVRVSDPGEVDWLSPGQTVEIAAFRAEND